ncbi:MAG: hypothetical protein WC505_06770 [Patescibacteria group bacterium]
MPVDLDSATFLQIGEPVGTPEGPGVVVDIALNLANYGGELQIDPPAISVKLDSGKTIQACLCSLDFGDPDINAEISREFDRLWPPVESVPEAGLERTAISPRYDTTVLLGETLEEFAPDVAAKAAGLGLVDAIKIYDKVYAPLTRDRRPGEEVMRLVELEKYLVIEMNSIPTHYRDTIDTWLMRQFELNVRWVAVLPA